MNRNTMKSAAAIFLTFFSLTHMSRAEDVVKASGKWTGKEHSIAGYWKIVDDGSSLRLKLYSLKTKKAPDLKIFFSPRTVAQSTANNATQGTYFFHKLKTHNGNQSYVLPKGFDLDKYKSILIHCQKYTKLWGGANLR